MKSSFICMKSEPLNNLHRKGPTRFLNMTFFLIIILTFLNDKNKSSRWKFTQFRNMLKKLFIIILKIFK